MLPRYRPFSGRLQKQLGWARSAGPAGHKPATETEHWSLQLARQKATSSICAPRGRKDIRFQYACLTDF